MSLYNRFKKYHFLSHKGFSVGWLLTFMLMSTSCAAQKSMTSRISSAERSDGKGYVIRFNMSGNIDSFQLSQPRSNLIHFAIFGQNIDADNISFSIKSILKPVEVYSIDEGVGMVLQIKGDTFFIADAYPDGASDDILLALTETTESELTAHIQSQSSLAWAPAVEPVVEIQKVSTKPTRYDKLKAKLEFDVVVLDAGHGGHDVGAISYRNNYEKDIVLSITKKVGNYIKEYMPEVEVVYTRDRDTFIGLEERGQIANRASGDLFVSIHANAFSNSNVHGTEVYFLGLERSQSALEVMKRENNVVDLENGDTDAIISQQELFIYELANSANIAASQNIAGMISHQFEERALRRSRGVKQARFVVLYHASMPAILVETGFITNPDEGHYLTTEYGQTIIASAIFRAIRNYKEQFEKNFYIGETE